MDMQGVKVDPVKIEQGAWVGEEYGTPIPDMGDLCLQVRGINCAAWKSLQLKLIRAVPRNKRSGGAIAQDEMERITNICLREVGVLGWTNLTDKGVPVPYSKETAAAYFGDPSMLAFRDAAVWACNNVGAEAAASVESDAKNSPTP